MAVPMYRQISDDLRAQIESGELGPGRQLPTEIELMEQYDASKNTVRDAIKLLTARGLVEPRPGQGTFVVERINPFVSTLSSDSRSGDEGVYYIAEVQGSGRKPGISDPRVEVQLANAVIANALHVEEGAQVVSRHQQRYIDDIPWSLQTSFYPITFVQRGAFRLLEAAAIDGGAVSYLAEALGIKQVGYQDSIAFRTPDEIENLFFKLPGDGQTPVFEIFRVGFGSDGSRVGLTITVYPADRNRFIINAGSIPKEP